jgi:hypothetical protein
MLQYMRHKLEEKEAMQARGAGCLGTSSIDRLQLLPPLPLLPLLRAACTGLACSSRTVGSS